MLGFLMGIVSCVMALLVFMILIFVAFGSAASAFED